MAPIFIPRPLLLRLFLFYHRGIIVYIEYQSVCPFVWIEPPTPYTVSESGSILAPRTQVGGTHSIPGEVVGDPIPMKGQNLCYSTVCIIL